MKPHFLLIGNGPYQNRGCEAIVRGTVKLIEHFWGDDFTISQGIIGNAAAIAQQAEQEFDRRITHIPIEIYPQRFSPTWCSNQIGRLSRYHSPRLAMRPKGVDRDLLRADCVLQVGGDNYSLHHEQFPPFPVVDIDHYILRRSKAPVAIWGASIGPFSTLPHIEELMMSHLARIPAIMARETITYDYLEKHGITKNLHLVADPAFLMEPIQPVDWLEIAPFATHAIGINVSPLLASLATEGNLTAWIETCANTVTALSRHFHKPILLIPHVTIPETSDSVMMGKVLDQVYAKGLTPSDVRLLHAHYSAQELKYIISFLDVFAGARMHAAIAAISTGVPTLSLTYSIKSMGVFRDIYQSDDYYIHAKNISPEFVVEKIDWLLKDAGAIRERLRAQQLILKERALKAGVILQELMNSVVRREGHL